MSIHTTIQINIIREGEVSVYHQDLAEAEPKFTVARIGWPEDHIAIMLPYGSRLSIVRQADIVP